MDVTRAVQLIEEEGEQPDGALGKLRMGIWNVIGLDRLLQILREVEVPDELQINRRLVAVTWYMPIFVSWQKGRILKNGGNPIAFDVYENRIHDAVVEMLGYP